MALRTTGAYEKRTSETEFGTRRSWPARGGATTEAAVTSDVLAEALALKQALQDALGKTSTLIAALRRQTRQWSL